MYFIRQNVLHNMFVRGKIYTNKIKLKKPSIDGLSFHKASAPKNVWRHFQGAPRY
jgi:hypothetical protein